MDKNLRDRVEKIAFDCLEEEIAEMEWLKDGCHKIATALCFLIIKDKIEFLRKYVPYILVDGEVKSKVELIYELESQLKDQKRNQQ